jgi:hypothetical protein
MATVVLCSRPGGRSPRSVIVGRASSRRMESVTRLHGADLRKGRWSASNQIDHLTAVTRGRSPVFTDLGAARTLIRVLREAEERELAKTLALW